MGIATTSMLKSVAFAAAVASATAFAPAAVGPATRGNTAVCANKFGQSSPAGAPPADLFNIWRDDYMLTPAQAAAEEAERKANTFFDGVLPPFSTANPTSAYDTANFGKVEIFNKDVLKNPITGEGPEIAGKKTIAAAEKRADTPSYASQSLANFARWRRGEATDDTRRFDLQKGDY